MDHMFVNISHGGVCKSEEKEFASQFTAISFHPFLCSRTFFIHLEFPSSVTKSRYCSEAWKSKEEKKETVSLNWRKIINFISILSWRIPIVRALFGVLPIVLADWLGIYYVCTLIPRWGGHLFYSWRQAVMNEKSMWYLQILLLLRSLTTRWPISKCGR